MKLQLEDADVAAIAEQVAAIVVAKLSAAPSDPPGTLPRIHWPEADAAAALGISHFTLRDWREKGYVRASTTTRPILYSREDVDAAAKWMRTRDR